jgi:AcrR family transcriptional regulator
VSAAPRKRLGRPPAIESAETRQRILTAARRAFAERGYDATTNKDVAAEVGITTGAIYHYFASKADLYLAVYDEVQDLVYGRFEKAVLTHRRFADRLDAVLDESVELNRHEPSLAAFVVGVPTEAARHPDLAERLAPLQARARAFFRDMVDEALAAGEIESGVTAEAVNDVINALLAGLARQANLVGDPARHARATEVVKRLVDGRLLVRKPRRRGTTAAR